jgi:hypothetical protein
VSSGRSPDNRHASGIRSPALAGIDKMAGIPQSGNRGRRRLMQQTKRYLGFPTSGATTGLYVRDDLLLTPSFRLRVQTVVGSN